MGFNPFKWYSKGKIHKPLKPSAPLLLKIRNGDFNPSSYFREAEVAKCDYMKIYNTEYESHSTNEESVKRFHAHQKARMRNVAYLKLMEEVMVDEDRILKKLRDGLFDEFGSDYWKNATSIEMGLKTIEDIYWKYKELSGMGTTPSEIAIQLNRKSSKGLK
jgi:hypothetical protein